MSKLRESMSYEELCKLIKQIRVKGFEKLSRGQKRNLIVATLYLAEVARDNYLEVSRILEEKVAENTKTIKSVSKLSGELSNLDQNSTRYSYLVDEKNQLLHSYFTNLVLIQSLEKECFSLKASLDLARAKFVFFESFQRNITIEYRQNCVAHINRIISKIKTFNQSIEESKEAIKKYDKAKLGYQVEENNIKTGNEIVGLYKEILQQYNVIKIIVFSSELNGNKDSFQQKVISDNELFKAVEQIHQTNKEKIGEHTKVRLKIHTFSNEKAWLTLQQEIEEKINHYIKEYIKIKNNINDIQEIIDEGGDLSNFGYDVGRSIKFYLFQHEVLMFSHKSNLEQYLILKDELLAVGHTLGYCEALPQPKGHHGQLIYWQSRRIILQNQVNQNTKAMNKAEGEKLDFIILKHSWLLERLEKAEKDLYEAKKLHRQGKLSIHNSPFTQSYKKSAQNSSQIKNNAVERKSPKDGDELIYDPMINRVRRLRDKGNPWITEEKEDPLLSEEEIIKKAFEKLHKVRILNGSEDCFTQTTQPVKSISAVPKKHVMTASQDYVLYLEARAYWERRYRKFLTKEFTFQPVKKIGPAAKPPQKLLSNDKEGLSFKDVIDFAEKALPFVAAGAALGAQGKNFKKAINPAARLMRQAPKIPSHQMKNAPNTPAQQMKNAPNTPPGGSIKYRGHGPTPKGLDSAFYKRKNLEKYSRGSIPFGIGGCSKKAVLPD